MGQATWCYDCCWVSQCQWHGASVSCLICNCWLCIPQRLAVYRGDETIKCGFNQGCGSDCFCGYYQCIPDWLKRYSLRQTIDNFTGDLGDIQILAAPPGNTGALANGNPYSAQAFGQPQMMGVQQPNYNPYPYQG